MAFQKVQIVDASAKLLADFAEQVLGLDGVDYRLGKDKIHEKMRAAMYDKDFIEVEGKEADIQRIDPPRPQAARRMAVIRIHNQDKPGGTEPVPAAVNGKQLFIPRNQDCTIPWEYYHALDNAKQFVYQVDENKALIYPPSEVHEYPFSLIREDPPLPEEQKAA